MFGMNKLAFPYFDYQYCEGRFSNLQCFILIKPNKIISAQDYEKPSR